MPDDTPRYIAGTPAQHSSVLKPLDFLSLELFVESMHKNKCNNASSSSIVLPGLFRLFKSPSDSSASLLLAGQKAHQATQTFKELFLQRNYSSSPQKKSANPQVSTPTTSRTLLPHRPRSQEGSSDTSSMVTRGLIRSLLPQLQEPLLPHRPLSQEGSSDTSSMVTRGLIRSLIPQLQEPLLPQSQGDSSDVGGIHQALRAESQEDSSDGNEIHEENIMDLFTFLASELPVSKKDLQLPCPFSIQNTYFEGEDDRDRRSLYDSSTSDLCSLPHVQAGEDDQWGGGEDHNLFVENLHEIMGDEDIKEMFEEHAKPSDVGDAHRAILQRSKFLVRKRGRSDNMRHNCNNFEKGFAHEKHNHGIYQKHNHLIHYNGELLYLIVLMMHTSTIVSYCTSTIASFTLVVTTRRCVVFLIH